MPELPDGEALARAVARTLYERDPCPRTHGVEIEAVSQGYARLSMRVRPDMVNGHQICHGGMIFMLADTALAYAANASNHVTVASAADIVFVAPARIGDLLTAECHETHQKDRNGVYDVVVRTANETTIALYRGQARRVPGQVVPDRHGPEEGAG